MSTKSRLGGDDLVRLMIYGNGTRDWLRLQLIARREGATAGPLLAERIEKALEPAAEHARELIAFLDKHGTEVSERIAAASENSDCDCRARADTLRTRLGEDPVAKAREGAEAFLAGIDDQRLALRERISKGEPAPSHGDSFCNAVWFMMLDLWAVCPEEPDACDELDEYAEVYDEYGC